MFHPDQEQDIFSLYLHWTMEVVTIQSDPIKSISIPLHLIYVYKLTSDWGPGDEVGVMD